MVTNHVRMKQTLSLTIELLTYLQGEGYQFIVLRYGANVFEPRKEDVDDIVEILNLAPMHEDDAIAIEDAITQFDELELAEKEILNVFNI